MPWFRARTGCHPTSPDARSCSDLATVRQLVADALCPAHFFTGSLTALEWEYTAREDIAWEVFQGRLLDPVHTTARQQFEAWHVFLTSPEGRSAEPVLSVKLDARARQLQVVRAIYCHAWEGYHAGDNVYLSRETRKWVRELVGTIDLNRFPTADELRDELICRLFHAVVGASRLPLTSVEAPLPGFSLGCLAYGYQPRPAPRDAAAPMTSPRDLIERGLHDQLAWREKAKLLETILRCVAPEDLTETARLFVTRWRGLGHTSQHFLHLLRTLFDEVALSPYTGFVDTTLACVHRLVATSYLATEDAADFLGYLLRHLARHLTAYDLVTFHHRGANYPDALLVDTVLKTYLRLIESAPSLFSAAASDSEGDKKHKRLRRRALRQGWLIRRFYEGLPVPDVPTSPGENVRVLPAPHARVPEEQILLPARRTKRLFDQDPLPQHLGERGGLLLHESIRELRHPAELQELGTAAFLDRPLGVRKPPGEPDQTLLLAYETFSRSIAERRLRYLANSLGLIPDPADLADYQHVLADLQPSGLPPPRPSPGQTPERVSLAACRNAADDFIVLRTTRGSVGDFLALFDFSELPSGLLPEAGLIMRGGEATLLHYDAALRPRLEFVIDPHTGYTSRGGVEFPAGGLRVTRVWEQGHPGESLRERRLDNLVVRPRS